MVDTIRYRFNSLDGKEYGLSNYSVQDSEGYEWNFGPNESRVLPADANRAGLAVGDIVVDSAEQPARV